MRRGPQQRFSPVWGSSLLGAPRPSVRRGTSVGPSPLQYPPTTPCLFIAPTRSFTLTSPPHFTIARFSVNSSRAFLRQYRSSVLLLQAFRMTYTRSSKRGRSPSVDSNMSSVCVLLSLVVLSGAQCISIHTHYGLFTDFCSPPRSPRSLSSSSLRLNLSPMLTAPSSRPRSSRRWLPPSRTTPSRPTQTRKLGLMIRGGVLIVL